jgi:hypothetical protein
MITQTTYFEKFHGPDFPGLTLSRVAEIFIPASELRVHFAGEVQSDLSPVTQAILGLVEFGIRDQRELASALGLDANLTSQCILDEITTSRLAFADAKRSLETTALGRAALNQGFMTSKFSSNKKLIFDQVVRTITDWSLTSYKTKMSEIESAIPWPAEDKLAAIKVQEIDRQKLGTLIQTKKEQKSAGKKVVLEVLKTRTNSKGFVIANLLVWQNRDASKASFSIHFKGQRLFLHEERLAELGGLDALQIHPQPIRDSEIASIVENAGGVSQQSDTDDLASLQEAYKARAQLIPDGGSVRPAAHREHLQRALQVTKNRLVIIAPWVNSWVVDKDFLQKLRFLLDKKSVDVTIAWGFDDESGKHKGKSKPAALKGLLKLAEEFDNLNFLKMDASHAKVLLYDDTYICTSHNWLSYTGDQPRLEWGEKRTAPSVVTDRYQELVLDILPTISHPATAKDF